MVLMVGRMQQDPTDVIVVEKRKRKQSLKDK
jgi:hypothetical protein